MKLFFNQLTTSTTHNNSIIEILTGLVQLRRQGGFSGEPFKGFAREALDTISVSWPDSQHKRMVVERLAELTD